MFFQGKTSSIHTPGPQKLVYMGSDISQIQLYPGFEELVFCKLYGTVKTARVEVSSTLIIQMGSLQMFAFTPWFRSPFLNGLMTQMWYLQFLETMTSLPAEGTDDVYARRICLIRIKAEKVPLDAGEMVHLKMVLPLYKHLLGQWLNFKLFGITYLVGKVKFKLLFQGPLAKWEHKPLKKIVFFQVGGALFQWFFQCQEPWVFQSVYQQKFCQSQIPSPKLTWHLKITPWKRRFLLENTIFRGYVGFRECKSFVPLQGGEKTWPFERLDWWPTQPSRIRRLGHELNHLVYST